MLYTAQQWGSAQGESYSEEIDRALAELGEHPHVGRPRDDVRPGLRSLRVEQHVIYYRVDADSVIVLRVLHRKMDAIHHIEEP
jgi:toxin ParE1/3/4